MSNELARALIRLDELHASSSIDDAPTRPDWLRQALQMARDAIASHTGEAEPGAAARTEAINAALSNPAPVAAPATTDMVLIPRELIGAACAAIRLRPKYSAEKTLAELRRYTFGDLSAPALASEAVASLKRLIGSAVNYPHTERSQKWAAEVFALIDTIATPGDSADAPVQQAGEAKTALLIEALEAMLSEAETHCRSPYCDINFEEELLEKARAALKGEQPAK